MRSHQCVLCDPPGGVTTRRREPTGTSPSARSRAELFEALLRDVDGIATRIISSLRQLPSYATVAPKALHEGAAGHVRAMVSAARDSRTSPTAEERRMFAATGETRAHQGVPVEDLLRGWRVGINHVWTEVKTAGVRFGLDDADLLGALQTLLAFTDEAMIAASGGHRQADVELARQELEHRARFVRAVLFSSLSPAELRLQAEVYGLDPAVPYFAIRAHASNAFTARELERMLAHAGGDARRAAHVAIHEGDVIGFAAAVPSVEPPVAVGVGPAGRLEAMERSFSLATRALATATAFRLTGMRAFVDLGIRPAIVDDTHITERLTAVYVEPLRRGSRPRDTLLTTAETFLDSGMNVSLAATRLHVHANTLRYRLARIKEFTGMDFENPAQVCELWWALQYTKVTAPPATE
jgi:hypothetical protein